MVCQWLVNFRMVGPVECTSLVTRIATSLGVLNWAQFSYITMPRPSIDLAYLVQGHTLKSASDGSIIFFFPGYVNEIPLPNPRLRLYKRHGYILSCSPSKHLAGVVCREGWPEAGPEMMRWICRHHNHKLFLVMQGMHPLVERPDPHPDSSSVGTDMFRNPMLEVHHGKAQVALSGINPHEWTGHTPATPVRAEHLHSLLPDAHFQPEVIATSLRGWMTSTSESETSMIGRNRPMENSPNIFKTPHDTTHSNKWITKPPWRCCGRSMKRLKLSTGTTGITRHPVSKWAWGEGVPEGNMYLAFAYFPFPSTCIAC